MTQVLWFEPHLGRPPHITALTGLSTMGGGSEGSTVLLQGSCLVELEGRSGDGCNLQSKPTKVIPGYGSCCYLFFRFRLNSNHTFKEENTSVSLIFPYQRSPLFLTKVVCVGVHGVCFFCSCGRPPFSTICSHWKTFSSADQTFLQSDPAMNRIRLHIVQYIFF